MKKLFSVFLSAFLLLGAVATTASADSVKGQKYYLKFMKITEDLYWKQQILRKHC